MQSTWDCTSSCSIWTDQGLMWGKFVDFSSAFNTIIPDTLQNKLTQLSVPTSISQWITSFPTDRQQVVRRTAPVRSALELLRAVFSPHCSSPSTPMTAHLKTPPSSSWSLQTSQHQSASFMVVNSLLTDRRLRSRLSDAVLTTWSLTRSKQWRWPWTSGDFWMLWTGFSLRLSQYFGALSFSYILMSPSVHAAEKQPHSTRLLPAHFTFGM